MTTDQNDLPSEATKESLVIALEALETVRQCQQAYAVILAIDCKGEQQVMTFDCEETYTQWQKDHGNPLRRGDQS